MEEAEPAAWPERFVYVCGATAGARVNRAPMLHAKDRIAGVMILRGISAKPPTHSDQVQSVQPTERLIDYARNVLGLGKDRVKVMDGHVESFNDWLGALGSARDFAREVGVDDVVYNVSGGSKQCTLGALLGLAPQTETPKVSLISVGRTTAVRSVSFAKTGEVRERQLPMTERLSLSDYLQGYGYAEIRPRERRNGEKRFRKTASIGSAILDAYGSTPEKKVFSDRFHEMQTAVTRPGLGKPHPRAPWTAFETEVPERSLTFFQDHGWLDRVQGAKAVTPSRLAVCEQYAQEFLGGKWLEAVIYARLRDAFAGRNDVEIAAGLQLGLAGAEGKQPQNATGEGDLVILADERLDVVEAKAVTKPGGLNTVLENLAGRRGEIAGPAGRVWMVAPFLTRQQLKKSGVLDNAHHKGVELLYAADAVDQLVGRVRKSIGGAR